MHSKVTTPCIKNMINFTYFHVSYNRELCICVSNQEDSFDVSATFSAILDHVSNIEAERIHRQSLKVSLSHEVGKLIIFLCRDPL